VIHPAAQPPEAHALDHKNLLPDIVIDWLADRDKAYLADVFERYAGFPELEEIWQLMDDAWVAHRCDASVFDGRVTDFYSDPVWLLNGLFIEQHPESLRHRHEFAAWVSNQAPTRVADYGGGFGSLARMIGESLPSATVEVIEPHPHPAALALADSTPNVRFAQALSGEYDVLIATDVFEHVPDPIELAEKTASYLRTQGQYLIANCFRPVILCHLPQLFYLDGTWPTVMKAMGLLPGQHVAYGQAFERTAHLDVDAAHRVANRARLLYPLTRRLPPRLRRMSYRLFAKQ
jgi:hypothetical protein